MAIFARTLRLSKGLSMGLSKRLAPGLSAVLALTASAIAPASAQTVENSTRYDTISARQIGALLGEFGVSTQLRASNRPGNAPVILATTPGGGQFLVGFFQCSEPDKASGCLQIMISTAQPSAGTTYDDLNLFNGLSSVTTAVYEPSNQILIFGRNIFFPGGVVHENLKVNFVLFLQDLDKFSASKSGAANNVAFGVTPWSRGKIDGFQTEPNKTLAENFAARRMLISEDASLEVEIAIENSTGVDFTVED